MSEGMLGREYADGETICREGDVGDCMYVIQAGRALVLRKEDGGTIAIGELAPGDIFGEMVIFERQPRSATVLAKGTARLLTLDRKAFLRAVHEDPSVAYRILQMMSHRIRSLNDELVRLQARLKQGQTTRSPIADLPSPLSTAVLHRSHRVLRAPPPAGTRRSITSSRASASRG